MRDLNPVVDVEDVSMMLMTLQNGAFASYQQCHFAPDYWRSYTIIGTEGRIENFGNGEPGTSVHLFNKRTDGYHPDAAKVISLDVKEGSHGGRGPVDGGRVPALRPRWWPHRHLTGGRSLRRCRGLRGCGVDPRRRWPGRRHSGSGRARSPLRGVARTRLAQT